MNKIEPNVLCHYGVLGMKWGIRRYQDYGKGYTNNSQLLNGMAANISSNVGAGLY